MNETRKLTFTDRKPGPSYGHSGDCLYVVGQDGFTSEQFWSVVQALVEADFQVTVEKVA